VTSTVKWLHYCEINNGIETQLYTLFEINITADLLPCKTEIILFRCWIFIY